MIDAFVIPTTPFMPFARSGPRLSDGTGSEGGAVSAPADVRVDRIALGEALQREAPILLAAARAITLDDREAEDLVQATFELALRNVGQLREPAALRAWLLTIQAREAFRVRRRLRRMVRLAPAVADLTIAPDAPSDRVEVRAALRSLPPRMRAAVVLHHMAGLRVAEVAAALGTSENTVKSQLRVGLARLREALGDDRDE